jgi:hypothetical protein
VHLLPTTRVLHLDLAVEIHAPRARLSPAPHVVLILEIVIVSHENGQNHALVLAETTKTTTHPSDGLALKNLAVQETTTIIRTTDTIGPGATHTMMIERVGIDTGRIGHDGIRMMIARPDVGTIDMMALSRNDQSQRRTRSGRHRR